MPPTERVRCVHADPDVRDRLAAVLAAPDRTVETVADAETALAQLSGVDCLVSGQELPDGDGLDLLATVREDRPHLPFVLVPADGDEALASAAFAADATDYVPLHLDGVEGSLPTRVDEAIAGPDAPDSERFRALIEHSTDLVSVLGPDGTFRYASPSVEAIFGYEPEELIGDVAFDYLHEADREAVMEKFFDALADPSYRPTAEFRFRNAAGEWRVVEARGNNRLDDPAVEGFVVNGRDVTERRRREQALRTERALTDGILETIPDIVYAFDHDGDPIREDLAVSQVPGYTEEELIERHPLEFVPEADREKVAAAIGSVLEEGDVETVESAIVTGDGAVIPHEFNGAPLTDEDGTVLGLVGAARDISDRLEYERRLERQNERLEEFAAVVSHDLRNPLNVITGHLELARRSGDEEHLDAIETAAERMEAMITDLLSLARQGRTIGDVEPVALPAVAREAWAGVETDEASMELLSPPDVVADGERLYELFQNLFRNAVEHGSRDEDGTEGGGDGPASAGVTVTVGSLPDGFYVADDGPGIQADDRDRILEHGYTTSEDGTGLGLAIVQSIVDAHGWELRVGDSEAGGARFEVVGVERTDPDPNTDGDSEAEVVRS